jgi:hypothetical protein
MFKREIMRIIFICLFIWVSMAAQSQSRSISRFRSDFKENSNMFFYSSTLKMLNPDNNPELADVIKGIDEIRVLNYTKAQQPFKKQDITNLKNALQEEGYNIIMMVNQQGNAINLYNREKHGNTVGFVALIENSESMILVDLIGNIDVKKFMELKGKLDAMKEEKTITY